VIRNLKAATQRIAIFKTHAPRAIIANEIEAHKTFKNKIGNGYKSAEGKDEMKENNSING